MSSQVAWATAISSCRKRTDTPCFNETARFEDGGVPGGQHRLDRGAALEPLAGHVDKVGMLGEERGERPHVVLVPVSPN
jgi:hypothetical protein